MGIILYKAHEDYCTLFKINRSMNSMGTKHCCLFRKAHLGEDEVALAQQQGPAGRRQQPKELKKNTFPFLRGVWRNNDKYI